MTTPIRQTTTVRYQDLDVTIIGELHAGLLAIAGYGTPQEFAIVAIAVQQIGDRWVYSVAGGKGCTESVEAVAEAAVRAREARPDGYDC